MVSISNIADELEDLVPTLDGLATGAAALAKLAFDATPPLAMAYEADVSDGIAAEAEM